MAAAKRQWSGGDHPGNGGIYSKAEVDDLLADMHNDAVAMSKAAVAEVASKPEQGILGSVQGLFKKYDKRIQAKFSAHDGWIEDLDKRINEMEEKGPATQSAISNLEKCLAVAQSTTVNIDHPDDWEREAGPTLLRARAAEAVTLEAVQNLVRGMAEDEGLKDSDGKNSDGAPHQWPARACKEVVQGRQFFPKKRDGEVSTDWTPLAKVVDITSTDYRLKWNFTKAEAIGMGSEIARPSAGRWRPP